MDLASRSPLRPPARIPVSVSGDTGTGGLVVPLDIGSYGFLYESSLGSFKGSIYGYDGLGLNLGLIGVEIGVFNEFYDYSPENSLYDDATTYSKAVF